MEAAVVSASHGAMASLLGKLGELLTAKYRLLKEAKGQIMFLKAELESMHVFLKKISDTEEPDEQDKFWAKEVRELSYDIEDSVNEFMLRVEHDSNKPRGFKGFITRSTKLLTTMNNRNEIAKGFEGLKIRVKEVSERRARYKIDIPKTDNTTIDLRLLAVHAETVGLVGIEGPRDELIRLMDEEGEPARQLKVLSIVGFGGIGKTTLANEIYRNLAGKFQCRAFVSVSQKPNIRKILRTILSQVGFQAPKGNNMEMWEEPELISALQKFLFDQRYFIVIDDIWDVSAWDIIRCALPENMGGSRVITTTRIETVARACCGNNVECVYKIKALSDQDSRILFFKRIFGSEDACPPYLKEVSVEFLKKCGGLPLPVITLSSLLANQPYKLKEQWKYLLKSLGSNIEVSPSLNDIRQILNLSYTNLPRYLKTCMLYLGIYPEDYMIDRNDLIRLWIAEGFIIKAHGIDPEDVAKSYFSELINRSMIQPSNINCIGEVMSCRVHDMMLDLILLKSREENFITVIDDIQDMARQQEKIRRLSLNLDGPIDERVVGSILLSQVRMLARFVKIITYNGLIKLPRKIGGLHQLETFHVEILLAWSSSKNLPLCELPTDIVRMNQLLHLILPYGTRLPDGIEGMKSLRTLHSFYIGLNSTENIEGLGELTNLTDLEIKDHSNNVDGVVERAGREVLLKNCLEKLCNLKYLSMYFDTIDAHVDGLSSVPASFCHLQRFCGSRFSTVPGWIGRLSSLYDLELGVKEVLKDDVEILAQLPSLIHLSLHILGAPKDKILICGGSGFPVLKHFEFRCSRISCLTFGSRAMPKLERLELGFNARGWDRYGAAPGGIEHLSSLKGIHVDIWGSGAKESNRRAAESALRDAIDMHQGRPVASIELWERSWWGSCYCTDAADEPEPGEEDRN